MVAKNNQRGIALVEVIAALAVSVIVITALVSLSLYSLRSSLKSKLLLEGTKIANTQLELVRAYREQELDDWDWDGFTGGLSDNCDPECHFSSVNILEGGRGTNNIDPLEQVSYWITYSTTPEGIIRITSTAEWQIGGQTHQTLVYTDLSNWRESL